MLTICNRCALVTGLLVVLFRLLAFGQESGDWTREFQESCTFSVDRYIAELQEEESWRRNIASECLGEMEDRRGVEPLVNAILKEDNVRSPLYETAALKKLNDPRAEEILLAALTDKQTRTAAIETLGRLGSKGAVEPLIALLQNSDKWTIVAVAGALGEIKDARALPPLCAVIHSRDEVVRRFAAGALGELGDQGALAPLTAALQDTDDGVRWNAAISLGKLKNVQAVEALIAVLEDGDEYVRVAALDALGSIGDTRAVQPLITVLTSATGRTKWHAALSLETLNASEAGDALTDAMRRGDLSVVAAAYKYFLAKNDPDSVDALAYAMSEHGWDEMAAALLNSGNSRLADAARQWQLRSEDQLQP